MNYSKQSSQITMRTCNLCNKSTEAQGISLLYFGEWMSKKDITVHYYCLLLSTHIPQRGQDHGGILGFLLRDIRLEIAKAKTRKCRYCLEEGASIQCFKCKSYFHLTCGHTSRCLHYFARDFRSYCHECVPTDRYKMQIFKCKPPQPTHLCAICAQIMGSNTKSWIYAKCCGNGFTHSKCMKKYALSAGYYLKCIWCGDKQFREDVKYQGVFVPDREANWEQEKGAYGELYRRHKRCDMEICNCPKGRDYSNAFKWQLITCKLCGAYGAHNPACIPGYEGSREKLKEYKCDVCSVTEQTVVSKMALATGFGLINTSLYVNKNKTDENDHTIFVSNFSQEMTLSGENNMESDVSKGLPTNSATEEIFVPEHYNLTQSLTNNQPIAASELHAQKSVQEDISDSDDSISADLLVEKLLGVFEVNSKSETEQGMRLNEQNKLAPEVSKGANNSTEELFEAENYILTQSLNNSKPIASSEMCAKKTIEEESSDSDDSIIADMLVEKLLAAFEVSSVSV